MLSPGFMFSPPLSKVMPLPMIARWAGPEFRGRHAALDQPRWRHGSGTDREDSAETVRGEPVSSCTSTWTPSGVSIAAACRPSQSGVLTEDRVLARSRAHTAAAANARARSRFADVVGAPGASPQRRQVRPVAEPVGEGESVRSRAPFLR